MAITPDGVHELTVHGAPVIIEHDAGAGSSISDADFTIPSPSRNHCTTAPPMKMLPSRAYSVRSFSCQAIVVSSRCLEATGWVPMFINIKQPVP